MKTSRITQLIGILIIFLIANTPASFAQAVPTSCPTSLAIKIETAQKLFGEDVDINNLNVDQTAMLESVLMQAYRLAILDMYTESEKPIVQQYLDTMVSSQQLISLLNEERLTNGFALEEAQKGAGAAPAAEAAPAEEPPVTAPDTKARDAVIAKPEIIITEAALEGGLLKFKYPQELGEIELNGKKWIPKDEFHVTFLGFGKWLDIGGKKDKIENFLKSEKKLSKDDIKTEKQRLIAEAAKAVTTPFTVRLTGEYRLVEKEDPGTKVMRRTIIEIVKVDGMDEFYDNLDKKLTEYFGKPAKVDRTPPHITLFTGTDKQAIGLVSQADMDQSSKPMNEYGKEAFLKALAAPAAEAEAFRMQEPGLKMLSGMNLGLNIGQLVEAAYNIYQAFVSSKPYKRIKGWFKGVPSTPYYLQRWVESGSQSTVYEGTKDGKAVITKKVKTQKEIDNLPADVSVVMPEDYYSRDLTKNSIEKEKEIMNELLKALKEINVERFFPAVVDYSFDDKSRDNTYLTIEKIEGETLERRLEISKQPITEAEWDELMANVGKMHELGYLFVDVHLGNIIRGKDGKLWLVDFGMATKRSLVPGKFEEMLRAEKEEFARIKKTALELGLMIPTAKMTAEEAAASAKASLDNVAPIDTSNPATARDIAAAILGVAAPELIGVGGAKAVFDTPYPNKVLRVYSSTDHRNQLYSQLTGNTEADVAALINNDKLVVRIENVEGQPADLAEKVYPLTDLLKAVQKAGNHELAELLRQAWNSNPLLKERIFESEFVYSEEGSVSGKNAGIVIRGDQAYVVAFDLDTMEDIAPTDEAKKALKDKLAKVEPVGIPLADISSYLGIEKAQAAPAAPIVPAEEAAEAVTDAEIQSLIESAKSEDAAVRKASIERLADIVRKLPDTTETILPTMLDLIKDPDWNIKFINNAALAGVILNRPETAERIISALVGSFEDKGSYEILHALVNIAANVPGTSKIIAQALIKAFRELAKFEKKDIFGQKDIISSTLVDTPGTERYILDAIENPEYADIKAELIKILNSKLYTFIAQKDAPATLERILSMKETLPYELLKLSAAYKSVAERKPLTDEYLAPYGMTVEKDFPAASKLEEILKHTDDKKPKKLLILHNVKDGQGDELIRMIPLLQALIDKFPNLDITIYTGRQFMYESAPNVHIKDIKTFSKIAVPLDQEFDMMIEHGGGPDYGISMPALAESAKKPRVYVSTRKATDDFRIASLEIDGQAMPLTKDPDRTTVYTPTSILTAELGLPLRVGTDKPAGRNIIIGEGSAEAERWWEENVDRQNTEKRPVVFFNGFGGETEEKGYTRKEHGKMAEDIAALVEDGNFVIIFPNDMEWGTYAQAKDVFDRLTPEQQKHVRISPGPKGTAEVPNAGSLIKFWADKSEHIVTVEGGMMHLSYSLGKPFTLPLKAGAGESKWYRMPKSEEQTVVGYEGKPEDVRRNVRTAMEEAEEAEREEAAPAALEPEDIEWLNYLDQLKKEGHAPEYTYAGRLSASQSAVKSLARAGSLVIDVGIGGKDAPTFRELKESLGADITTKAIEIDQRNVPADLSNDVIIANILNIKAGTDAAKAIREADVIRISNLVIPYMEAEQRKELLASLQKLMKEGAYLIISHTEGSGLKNKGEEGFVYIKVSGRLIAHSFVYTVLMSDGFFPVYGGHMMYTLLKREVRDKLVDSLDKATVDKIKELSADYDENRKYYSESSEGLRYFHEKEARLNDEILQAIARSLKSQGYEASTLGDMIRITLTVENVPEGLTVPEGLETPAAAAPPTLIQGILENPVLAAAGGATMLAFGMIPLFIFYQAGGLEATLGAAATTATVGIGAAVYKGISSLIGRIFPAKAAVTEEAPATAPEAEALTEEAEALTEEFFPDEEFEDTGSILGEYPLPPTEGQTVKVRTAKGRVFQGTVIELQGLPGLPEKHIALREIMPDGTQGILLKLRAGLPKREFLHEFNKVLFWMDELDKVTGTEVDSAFFEKIDGLNAISLIKGTKEFRLIVRADGAIEPQIRTPYGFIFVSGGRFSRLISDFYGYLLNGKRIFGGVVDEFIGKEKPLAERLADEIEDKDLSKLFFPIGRDRLYRLYNIISEHPFLNYLVTKHSLLEIESKRLFLENLAINSYKGNPDAGAIYWPEIRTILGRADFWSYDTTSKELAIFHEAVHHVWANKLSEEDKQEVLEHMKKYHPSLLARIKEDPLYSQNSDLSLANEALAHLSPAIVIGRPDYKSRMHFPEEILPEDIEMYARLGIVPEESVQDIIEDTKFVYEDYYGFDILNDEAAVPRTFDELRHFRTSYGLALFGDFQSSVVPLPTDEQIEAELGMSKEEFAGISARARRNAIMRCLGVHIYQNEGDVFPDKRIFDSNLKPYFIGLEYEEYEKFSIYQNSKLSERMGQIRERTEELAFKVHDLIITAEQIDRYDKLLMQDLKEKYEEVQKAEIHQGEKERMMRELRPAIRMMEERKVISEKAEAAARAELFKELDALRDRALAIGGSSLAERIAATKGKIESGKLPDYNIPSSIRNLRSSVEDAEKEYNKEKKPRLTPPAYGASFGFNPLVLFRGAYELYNLAKGWWQERTARIQTAEKIRQLIALTKSEKPDQRLLAFKELKNIMISNPDTTEEILPALLDMLAIESEREEIISALTTIAIDRPDTTDSIISALIRSANGLDDLSKAASVEGLRKILQDQPEKMTRILPDLLQINTAGNYNRATRSKMSALLGDIVINHPDTVEEIFSDAKSGGMYPEDIAVLRIIAVNNPDKAEEITSLLINQINPHRTAEGETGAREASVKALEKIAISQPEETERIERIVKALTYTAQDMHFRRTFARRSAVYALANIAISQPDTAKTIIPVLEELTRVQGITGETVRRASAIALGEIAASQPSTAKTIIPILEELTKEDDEIVRYASVEALQDIRKAEEAQPAEMTEEARLLQAFGAVTENPAEEVDRIRVLVQSDKIADYIQAAAREDDANALVIIRKAVNEFAVDASQLDTLEGMITKAEQEISQHLIAPSEDQRLSYLKARLESGEITQDIASAEESLDFAELFRIRMVIDLFALEDLEISRIINFVLNNAESEILKRSIFNLESYEDLKQGLSLEDSIAVQEIMHNIENKKIDLNAEISAVVENLDLKRTLQLREAADRLGDADTLFSVNAALEEIKGKLYPAKEAPVEAPEIKPAETQVTAPEAAEAELPEEAPELTDMQRDVLEVVALRVDRSEDASILQTEMTDNQKRYMPELKEKGYITRTPEGRTFRVRLTPLFNKFFEITKDRIIEKAEITEEAEESEEEFIRRLAEEEVKKIEIC